MGGAMTSAGFESVQPQVRTRLFSLRGRLGRARYIAYSLGAIVAAFLFMFLAGMGLMLAGQLGRLLYVAVSVLLFYAFLPIFFAILTVKRAHDFNAGGWMALLLLVPVVNLLFWVIPGTRGDNDYGTVPPAASTGIKLIAATLPVLLVIAFLATGEPETLRESDLAQPAQPTSTLKPYTP